MKIRVVVTGVGLITPLGTGVEKTWSALCRGESGISHISQFDASTFDTQIAGEVKDFQAADFLPSKEAKRTERFIAFAVAAARMALEDSGLIITSENAARVGAITGSGLGGLSFLERTCTLINANGPKRVSPFFIPMLIGNMAPGMISIHLGAKGPNMSIATACAAGTHAVGQAFHLIRNGGADAMITGGVDALITYTCVAGFNAMKALSTRNHEPQAASRPFDRNRDGFVLGEGCGMVILETLESAQNRNAHIYAEVCGFGMSADAHHIAAPAPDGEGAARCMQNALEDAGIPPEAIGHINAHGTATPLNDLYETLAIKTVFKEKAYNIPISATKSMTGHLLGGAGGIETVFTALALHHGLLPPTINLDHPDPECDLDYVPLKARPWAGEYAMSNSFGFGGTNASLVLKRFKE